MHSAPILQIFPVSGAFPIPLEVLTMQIFLAGVVAFTYLAIAGSKIERYPKYDLLGIGLIKRMAKSRTFRLAVQMIVVAAFIFTLAAGFIGAQALDNINVVITWSWWYMLLFILALLVGRFWCFACPWKSIVDWILNRSFLKVRKERDVMGLHRPWPKKLRGIHIPLIFFSVLFLFDLAFIYGWKFIPIATSLLGVFFLIFTFLGLFFFSRGSFCRYACIVGWVQGSFTNFSPLELRARDKKICAEECKNKDCLNGNDSGYGCPTYQLLQVMDNNSQCLLCTECVKTCPYDNVSINIRPYGMDLVTSKRFGMNDAYFAIILLALSLFHRISMSPSWLEFGDTLNLPGLPGSGHVLAFIIGVSVSVSITYGGHYAFSSLSLKLSGNNNVNFRSVFSNYAYAFLPFPFLYLAGHCFEHLFSMGAEIIPAISDPFGWGWNLFGTAAVQPLPLFGTLALKWIITLFIIISVIACIWVAFQRSRIVFDDDREAFRSLIPIVVWIYVLTIVGIWFVAQPMIWVPYPVE